MTDPVAAAASIVTLITVCKSCTSRLSKFIQALRHAPEEIRALSKELNGIKVVLEALHEVHLDDSRVIKVAFIEEARGSAETLLAKLQSIANETLVPSANGTHHVNRLKWLLRKGKVLTLCKKLKNLMERLHMSLDANTASSVFRIDQAILTLGTESWRRHIENHSRFDQLLTQQHASHIILREVLAAQAISQSQQMGLLEQIHSRISSPPPSASRNYAAISDGEAEECLEQSNPFHSQTGSVLTTPSTAAFQATTISTLSIQLRRQSKCDEHCDCACHSKSRWRSPSFLDAYLGILLAGFSGLPLLTPNCNRPICRGNVARYIEVTYCLPQWFLQRAVYILAAMTNYGGPMMCLTVRRRMLSTGAINIFQMAAVGNAEGVRAVLSQKVAGPNDLNEYGETPLWAAVTGGQPEVCKLLLDAGADPHIPNDHNMTIAQHISMYVLSKGKGLRWAQHFTKLLPMGDSSEAFGFSQLHKVVLGLSRLDIDSALNNQTFRCDINQRDNQGKSPLYWAARRGDSDAVELLLRAGADVNARDHGADTPLAAAARSKSVRCLKILLHAGANVDSKDFFGYTPLAVVGRWHRDPAFAEVLVRGGANANSIDRRGATPFARAARYNRREIGEFLLTCGGADMNQCDLNGNPPLFEAIMKDRNEFVELLLSRGAKTDIVNQMGYNILHMLAIYANIQTIETVARARLEGLCFDAKDAKGKTPMQYLEERVAAPPGIQEALKSLM